MSVPISCLICGKVILVRPSYLKRRKTCSLSCSYVYRGQQRRTLDVVAKICCVCGKEFYTKHVAQMSCSKSCANKSLIKKTKVSVAQRGKAESVETRNQRSEQQKAMWQNVEYRDKMLHVLWAPDVQHRRSLSNKRCWQAMDEETRAQRRRNWFLAQSSSFNGIERKLDCWLQEKFPEQFRYVGDGKVVIARQCPDFIHVDRDLIVELNGCFFHDCPICRKSGDRHIRKQDDGDRIAHFAKYGYKTLIVWEHELKDKNAVMAKIDAFMTE